MRETHVVKDGSQPVLDDRSVLDEWPVQAAEHPGSELPTVPRPPMPRPWLYLAGAILLLALVAGAMLFGDRASNDPDEAGAPSADDETLAPPSTVQVGDTAETSTEPAEVVSAAGMPAILPTLEVERGSVAESGSILISGSGYQPHEALIVLQCVAGAAPPIQLVPACDTGTEHAFAADAAGDLMERTTARRLIASGPEIVDCAEGGCSVQVFSATSAVPRSSAPIVIASDVISDPVPRLQVGPSTLLADGVEVEINASQLAPGVSYLLGQCILGVSESGITCAAAFELDEAVAQPDGSIATELRAQRFLNVDDSWHDCSLTSSTCVVSLTPSPDTADAPRAPSAIPLSFDAAAEPARRQVTVTPATGLTDAATVTVVAEEHLLGEGESGLVLCQSGVEGACTALARNDIAGDPGTVSTQLQLPRRFVTWQGEIHDCVSISPCELQVWMNNEHVEHLDTAVDFAPGGDLAAGVRASISDAGPYGRAHDVVLSFSAGGQGAVVQCVVGKTNSCDRTQGVGDPSTAADEIESVSMRLHRRIITPRGPHDCLADSPCELRFITEDGRWVQPIVLKFVADTTPSLTASARPTRDLVDGDVIEVRVVDSDALWFVINVCIADTSNCTWLTSGSMNADDGATRVRITRHFGDPFGLHPDLEDFDCVEVPCVLRVGSGRDLIEIPLSFDPEGKPLPVPRLRVTASEVVEGTRLPIYAENFFVAHPDDANYVTTRWCASPDDPKEECLRTYGGKRRLGSSGTLETSVDVPQISETIREVGGQAICNPSCWLVMTQERELPSASVEVTLLEATG